MRRRPSQMSLECSPPTEGRARRAEAGRTTVCERQTPRIASAAPEKCSEHRAPDGGRSMTDRMLRLTVDTDVTSLTQAIHVENADGTLSAAFISPRGWS